MKDIYFYSYVEDAPSAEVVRRLVEVGNRINTNSHIILEEGFPVIKSGYVAIKEMCNVFVNMARAGIHTMVLVDLDDTDSPCTLIHEWFSLLEKEGASLPPECLFRIAVREVESWILADRKNWAEFIGIAASNFSSTPDLLDDPQRHIFEVVRSKGRKKFHRGMLPSGTSHIGPLYRAGKSSIGECCQVVLLT